jgi:tetratricopeptide (TPR) repeat protein
VAILEDVESLMREDRWREAIALCTASGQLDTDPDLLWNCAWAHFKLGDFGTARTLFEAGVSARPRHVGTLWALGIVHHRLGALAEAKRRLREALAIRDSTIARMELALVLTEEGDLAAAEEVHLEGISLQPSNADRYETYADFLSDRGRADEAALQYSKAKGLRA